MLNDIKHRTRTGRDRGMTLPELLIVVSIMGILGAVVAAAVTVSYRTVTGTEGRVNVARAEQSIDTWLPADLTSTDVTDTTLPAVDDSPGATPCGNPTSCDGVDMGGVNLLQLAWRTLVDQPHPNPPVEVITR
ncbi:MAG: type II secretion system protein, partial [Ilumatobacteraceae bacterium]